MISTMEQDNSENCNNTNNNCYNVKSPISNIRSIISNDINDYSNKTICGIDSSDEDEIIDNNDLDLDIESDLDIPLHVPQLKNIMAKHVYHHNGDCHLNQYGQCIYGYKYFCPHCHIGISGMYSNCMNNTCWNNIKNNRN